MYVGIDLGTTFSAVSRMQSGEPEIIPNREGDRLTPSVVLIQENSKVVVGEAAKEQAMIAPDSVIAAVKNYMGKQKEFSPGDGKTYTPEMISSFILRRLVQDAERFAGEKVEGAVVTIPAYFTDAQRKATEDAARLADLKLIATINEPTAAAIYYAGRHKQDKPVNIMIYDLGGGTFDVTIVRAQGTDVQVLSTHGLSGVGGKVFDQALVDRVCERFQDKHGIDLKSEEYRDEYQELTLKAENCKIQLSSQDSAAIPLRVGKAKESVVITRDFLEEEVKKLYLRTESSIKKAVREAKLTFDELDKVVLVGGSSKIPFIQRNIQALTGVAPSLDLNPDEAVSLGAAIYADLLSGKEPRTKVSDVCSHSIGIVVISRELEEVNHILIRRNSQIPCSVEERLYTTVSDQRSIRLTLTEGEFAELCDVTVLARQAVELPSDLPKGTQVDVTLSLDVNQLLHFYVKIPAAGIDKEYTISRVQNMDDQRLRELHGVTTSAQLISHPEENPAPAAPVDEEADGSSAGHREAPVPETPQAVEICFEKVVGMARARKVLGDLYTAAEYQNARAGFDLKTQLHHHFFLRGGAGTGKSLLAGRISAFLHELKLSDQADPCVLEGHRLGDLLGNDGSDLEKALKGCVGRTVIIDDLSGLFSDGNRGKNERPFLLRTVLERFAEQMNFILTGSKEDIDHLLTLEPSLSGWILYDIDLPAYSPEELTEIASVIARGRGYMLCAAAKEALSVQLEREYRSPVFQGGKTVEAIIGRATLRLARRVSQSDSVSKGTLMRIEAEDLDDVGENIKLEELLAQLDALTGLASVKEQVRKLAALARTNKEAKRMGLSSVGFGTLHMVFAGNAGTGKTTVARIVGGIYRALGVLPQGDKVVECTRADLVAPYVGQTAPKVKDKVRQAMGGVLFIDEAYSLCGDRDTFGQEAVDTLVSEIENHRSDLMVILAGYTEDMDKFLDRNQGLASRFPNRMEFADYTQEEMEQIFYGMLRSSDKTLAEGCQPLLSAFVAENRTKRGFGNARGIRNLRDKLLTAQSLRLSERMAAGEALCAEDFSTIIAEDLNTLVTQGEKGKSLDDWMAELNALTGLAWVKEQVQRKVNTVLAQQKMRQAGLAGSFDPGTLHMVFRGNAGTGKTTVARILAGIYNALGLLPDGEIFVECGRSDLVGEYQGHTAQKVKDVINRSLGGVLFIDEAYALCRDTNDTFGREAVDALIADMENHRKELMVILAGYSDDMDAFFEHNQGMASRVPTSLTFEDYTLDELFLIFRNIIKGKGFELSEEAGPLARALIARESSKHNFGNARGVRNIAERIAESHTAALGERIARGETLQKKDYLTILAADVARCGETEGL